jgi:hypothetical protein
MPADMGGKSPVRDGSNEESTLAEIKKFTSRFNLKPARLPWKSKISLNHDKRIIKYVSIVHKYLLRIFIF